MKLKYIFGQIVNNILAVLPKRNKIVFINFLGRGYGDSPKYIAEEIVRQSLPYDLDTTATLVKKYNKKTTLVPMGVKAYMPDDWYLQLSMRSSMPHKHWLMIANAPGIIDADYYNNPDNEGHIYFQVINLLPFDIILHKGDCIGQGIFLQYGVADDDSAAGERMGGFGSTDENSST